MSIQSSGATGAPSTTVSSPLDQLQSGVVPPTAAPGGPASTALAAGFAGPTTFNVLATPPATVAASAANGTPTPSSSGTPGGTGANAQQPGAGKTTQSGSNDGVANDVSATLTAVGASTDSAPGAASTTSGTTNGNANPTSAGTTAGQQPVSGAALNTANDTYGHLNAYLSVYA